MTRISQSSKGDNQTRRPTNLVDDGIVLNGQWEKTAAIIPQKSHEDFLRGSGVNISEELLRNRHSTVGTIVRKFGAGSLVDYYLVRHEKAKPGTNNEPEFAVYHRSEMTFTLG